MTALLLLGSLVLAVGFIRIGTRVFGSPYSAFGLFGAVWTITIGLYSIDFVSYVPLSASAWAILLGSVAAFLVGCLVAANISFTSERSTASPEEADYLRKWIYFLCPLGLVGFGMYLLLVDKYVGLGEFARNPYLVREFQDTDIFRREFVIGRQLNYLNIINVAFTAYWITVYRGRPQSSIVLLCGVAALLTTLGSVDRTTPFTAISWAFFASEFARIQRGEALDSRRSLVRMAVLAFALLTIFIGLAQWIGKTMENNREAQANVQVADPYGVAMPYIYLTGNLPAFGEFIRTNEGGTTSGKFILRPVAKAFQALDPTLEVPEEVGGYQRIPFSFNTTTWLNVFWTDFGIVGIVAFPFLVGLGATLLLNRTRARPTFGSVILLGLALFVVVNSVFVNKLVSGATWQFAGLTVFVAYLSRRNSGKLRNFRSIVAT